MKTNLNTNINKAAIEAVENEQEEYKLVGTYIRTKGLKLYAYNPTDDTVQEVDSIPQPTATVDGKLEVETIGYLTANINTKHIHFEALNTKTAQKRVEKYKAGKLKDLSNLKPAGGKINFF
jgi:hypothetical protein